MNPCCDFSHQNVDLALFSNCTLLEDQSEYQAYKADPGNTGNKGKLKSLIKDHRENHQPERFFFLPKAFSIPDMVVDFQKLVTIELTTLKEMCSDGTYVRAASLDSPFAETLLNKFSHYYGRIGKPDLRDDLVFERISKVLSA